MPRSYELVGAPSAPATGEHRNLLEPTDRRSRSRLELRSTNPLERFNREIGRRTDVVGIFPDDRSLIRLASMLAIEQNDEWLVGRRYLSAASMGPLLEERTHRHNDEEVLELQPA